MSYGQSVLNYFTNFFDLTSVINLIAVSVGLFILYFKKTKEKKAIIFMSIAPIVIAGLILLSDALIFGLLAYRDSIPAEVIKIMLLINRPIIASILVVIIYRKDRPRQLAAKITMIFAALCILNTVSKSFGMFVGEFTENEYYSVSFARATPYILLVFCTLLMRLYDINHFKTMNKELLVSLYITNLTLISISFFDCTIDEHILSVNILITIISVTVYLLMLLIYYASFKINEYRHKAINHEVQEKLATAKLNSLEIDKINREELSKLKHDIKNQISYIDVLLEQGKIDEVKTYISEFKIQNGEVLNTFMSANETINSIVNLELTKAKANNIKIEAKAIVPYTLPFKDIDLCSLITNILDNAIENCDPSSSHPIVFSILKQQDYIRFYCENSTRKEIDKEKGKLKSTKKESGHGYGIKIIKQIAQIYGGYAYFETKENKFICDVILELGEGMKNV